MLKPNGAWESIRTLWTKGSPEESGPRILRRFTTTKALVTVWEEGESSYADYEEDRLVKEGTRRIRCTREPPLAELQFPLSVGARWSPGGSKCAEGKSHGPKVLGSKHHVARAETVRVGRDDIACVVVRSEITYDVNGEPYVVTSTAWIMPSTGLTVRRVTERPGSVDPKDDVDPIREEIKLVSVSPA